VLSLTFFYADFSTNNDDLVVNTRLYHAWQEIP
jgi:hypothetical protein